MLEVIKTIAETYDTGDKEMVYTKGKEFRSKEISSMPISALLISSPNYILYDESVKKKFLIAFGSKLARRVHFCFAPHMLPKTDFTTFEDPIRAELDFKKAEVLQANKIKEALSPELEKIATYNLSKGNELLSISEEVFELFTIYKGYNEAFAETLPPKFPLSRLVREHLQWKALKLSGALAILRCHESVEEEDFLDSIRICELLDQDMQAFESELVKEPYELFADYMKEYSVQGKSELDLHQLRKHKFIPSNGDATKRMKDLIQLAAVYDKSATYKLEDNVIYYDQIVKTEKINISFKPVDNSGIYRAIENNATHEQLAEEKARVASTAQYGLETGETVFEDLAELLQRDMAYSPFIFENGRRKKENIRGGAKWLVFDVDDSTINVDECHLQLESINHHIALSSNPENRFKFRVLIELDSLVELDGLTWRYFYLAIAEDLGLNVDPLPQSQIFFSYTNGEREIISVTDAKPLEVRDYLMAASERVSTSEVNKKLTASQKSTKLKDKRNTFARAFEAEDGKGSLRLIWAAKHAYKDLGASKEEVIELVHEINEYWVHSMSEERLRTTVINQIERW